MALGIERKPISRLCGGMVAGEALDWNQRAFSGLCCASWLLRGLLPARSSALRISFCASRVRATHSCLTTSGPRLPRCRADSVGRRALRTRTLVQVPCRPLGVGHGSINSRRSIFSSKPGIGLPPSLVGRVAQHRSRSARRAERCRRFRAHDGRKWVGEDRPGADRELRSVAAHRPLRDVADVNPHESSVTADGPHSYHCAARLRPLPKPRHGAL